MDNEALEYFASKFKVETKNLNSMLEFFDHFINEEMVNEILDCTNERLNSEEQLITVYELRGFFGLLLLFGVTKKHDIEVSEIWNTESVHHLDWASVCMSRKRFLLICRKISFDQLSFRLERSFRDPKIFKMRNVLTIFKKNCVSGLIPGSKLCIDEQLYSFRGRCSFKQYIASKPAKYGIKFWAMVDCDTGYLLDCDVYLGINNK